MPPALSAFIQQIHPLSEPILQEVISCFQHMEYPKNYILLKQGKVCKHLYMLNNVLAHLGYEVYPKTWTKIPFLKHKTTSTHHNMHHQLFNGNYALYFTWWDKWMGTEFKDYEKRHAQIFERKDRV